MKPTLIIIAVIIAVIIALLVIGSLVFLFLPKNPSPATTGPSTQFPNSSSTNPNSSAGGSLGSPTTKTMTVAARGTGTPITVKDFVNDGVTVPDPSNAGKYDLTPFSSTEFAISYDASSQFFTIALQQEPLAQTRLDAQQYLLNALGISQDQLCNLNYYLGTDEHTNDTFAGKNLGFSFCPGATQLPN